MSKKPAPKTLKNKADRLFSLVVRARGVCERCGRRPPEVELQCAHILSRKYIATRWDEKNALALCKGDHHWGHQNPVEWMLWLEEMFGLDYIKGLREKALQYAGRVSRLDYEEIVAELKRRAEELEVAA